MYDGCSFIHSLFENKSIHVFNTSINMYSLSEIVLLTFKVAAAYQENGQPQLLSGPKKKLSIRPARDLPNSLTTIAPMHFFYSTSSQRKGIYAV